jgi:hypothetical protein
MFTAIKPVRVILHGEDGNELGVAHFRSGNWAPESDVEAEALRRVMPDLAEFGIREGAPPGPVPVPPESEAADAGPAPAPEPEDEKTEPTHRAAHRRKGGSDDA